MNRRCFLQSISEILISSGALYFLNGCGPSTQYYFNPYISKPFIAANMVHCVSGLGHKRGTFPFIMGGTCCCTPTEELVNIYHEDGLLLDYDLSMLITKYDEMGIVLEHDDGWQCNNQCDSGPHVVFGGKCMVSPTIGTQNYENVISGKKTIV